MRILFELGTGLRKAPDGRKSPGSCFLAALMVVTLLAACNSSLQAQLTGKGSIKGTVADSTGAVIGGATITSVNTDNGRTSTATSGGSGDYELSALDPGIYTVTITMTGFEKLTQENLHVNALEVANFNPVLTVGAASENITVTTAPPSLETSNATLGATMENELYAALPIQMGAAGSPDQRRATDFAVLMPGVQGNETNGNLTTNTGVVNGSGSRGAASAVYINGIPFTSAAGEGDTRFVWTAISVDAVNQFQVQTSGYSALYEGMGVQNYSIKSGTNKFHGAVYEYFRNTFLDTWGFYAPVLPNPYAGHPTKPTEHQNEYGILLSGPVWKNKLFLFLNYDGFRFSKGPVPTYQSGPTTAEMAGDFSALGKSTNPTLANGQDIYDPLSTTCNAGGTICTRTQYQGNKIPLGKQSVVAQYLQKFLPAPAITDPTVATNNYLFGYKTGLNNWMTTNRIDYVINDKHNLSLVGAVGRQASVGPAGQTTAGRNLGPIPYNYGQEFAPKTAVWIFEDNYTFSPHIVNQFKYGFGRYNGPTFNANRGGAYAATAAGITGLPAGQAQDAFPIVTFSGVNAPTQWAGTVASVAISNSYDLIDNLQWIKGRHSLTFGMMIQWLQYQNTTATTGTSQLTIANAISETGNYKSKSATLDTTTGLSYASFLAGAPDSETLTQNSVVESGARFRPISPYFQDDWKVNSKLTVNMGLRWDMYPTYREAHNQLSWFNPTITNPLTGNMGALQFAGNGSAGCNCRTNVSDYYKNFGPRIGFAYAASPKVVWRGSWGVMYTHGNGVGGSANSRTGTGTLGFTATPKPQATNGVPQNYLDSGFPAYTAPPFISASYGTGFTTLLTPLQSPQTVSYSDPYYGGRAPQYINWSFGMQYQLTDSTVLTVSYVGSQGHFIITDGGNGRGRWVNQLDPKYLSLYQSSTINLSAKATAANLAALGVTAPYASFDPNQLISQALKPFPQYNGMGDPYDNVANTNYNGLQMTLIRRYSKGLTYMLNYTWSRAIDDGGTFRSGYDIPAAYSGTGKAWKADRIERTVSTSNQPQHLVFSGVYDLPMGKGHMGGENAVTRALLSGYKFSTIIQAFSGSPLALTASNCGVNPSQGTCLPSMATSFNGKARINGAWGHGTVAKAGTPVNYIDPTAFITTPSTLAAPLFSNAPRTAPYNIYGPGNYSVDISLRRSFGVPKWEGAKLTVQGDLYNISNHTLFGGIGLVYGSSNFGQVSTQANLSRDGQLSARFEF